jgi:hypothetical protein
MRHSRLVLRRSGFLAVSLFAVALVFMGCGDDDVDAHASAAGDAAAPAAHAGPVGTKATATLLALADAVRSQSVGFRGDDGNPIVIDPATSAPLTADARFAVTNEGVDLALSVKGCVQYLKGYPLRIQDGSSCDDAAALGDVFGGERGAGMPGVYCGGTAGTGAFFYSRASTDPLSWTLGGPAASDIVGRLLVLHDPVSDEPLACGEIVAAPETMPDASVPDVPEPSLETQSALAGYCALKSAARDSTDPCPDRQQLVDCATTHCELSTCFDECADYASCADQEADVCTATSCAMDKACLACTGHVVQCLFEFCADALACAVPTPDGPCTKLEHCCATQGDFADRCLMLVHQLSGISGDPSCNGVMKDWDWNTHLPVPCTYEE